MPILVQRQQLLHNEATTMETSREMNVAGLESVLLQAAGPFSAVIRVQVTIDETNWETVTIASLEDGGLSDTMTAPGLYSIPITGAILLRSQILLLSQGTVTVTAHVSAPGAAYPFAAQDITIAGETIRLMGDGALAAGLDVLQFLGQMLVEQRITNLYLAAISGEGEFTEEDTEA